MTRAAERMGDHGADRIVVVHQQDPADRRRALRHDQLARRNNSLNTV
jgi:hypothetical protein